MSNQSNDIDQGRSVNAYVETNGGGLSCFQTMLLAWYFMNRRGLVTVVVQCYNFYATHPLLFVAIHFHMHCLQYTAIVMGTVQHATSILKPTITLLCTWHMVKWLFMASMYTCLNKLFHLEKLLTHQYGSAACEVFVAITNPVYHSKPHPHNKYDWLICLAIHMASWSTSSL